MTRGRVDGMREEKVGPHRSGGQASERVEGEGSAKQKNM
jgi:hypothetical protein